MPPRSAKGGAKKATRAVPKKQPKKAKSRSSSGDAGDGSTFAAVVDILIRTQKHSTYTHYWKDMLDSLRLVCKATKSVVDFRIATLAVFHRYNVENSDFKDLYSWPWLNISELTLREAGRDQDNVETLVTLPLTQMASLTIDYCTLAPLLKSNWPMLTNLSIRLEKNNAFGQVKKPKKRASKVEKAEVITFPNSLRFPK